MSAIESRKKDRFWNQLLDLISKGNVVPIVGEELLQLPGEPEGAALYSALARRYANSCGIELEESLQGNLSATVRRHPDFRDSPFNVYDDLGKEYEQWNPAIPEPLRALAKITHLNLFVSTTFDDLLERALNEERFQGMKQRTEVIAYSPKNVPTESQITDQLATGRPLVFQCFGNYKTPLQFALTEGDIVEYLHALQTAEYRPKRIFSELYDRPLLMLGNSFPDWLTRIFLRMSRQKSLHQGEAKQYISEAKNDPQLRFFLRNFTINTEVIDELGPAQFVLELAERWQERFGQQEVKPVSAMPTDGRPMAQNAVFISYCRTDATGAVSRDQDVALAIRDALVARDVDVWLDQRALEGGDDYSKKIRRYINTCSVFLPIISQTTESRPDGFFRMEWGWALERLPHFTGSDRQFLFPVLLDNVDPAQAMIPDEFKRIQFTKMVSETPDAELLDRLQTLYQKARPAGS